MILLKTKYSLRRNYTRSYHTPSMGLYSKCVQIYSFFLKKQYEKGKKLNKKYLYSPFVQKTRKTKHGFVLVITKGSVVLMSMDHLLQEYLPHQRPFVVLS